MKGNGNWVWNEDEVNEYYECCKEKQKWSFDISFKGVYKCFYLNC